MIKCSPLFLVICLLVTSCATKYLHEDRRGVGANVYYIAKGHQDIIVTKDKCLLDYNGIFYELTGLYNYVYNIDEITFWIENNNVTPNRFQVSNKDMFIHTGSIVPIHDVIQIKTSVTINGKLASFKPYQIKDMSKLGKIALTPFAFAIDVVTGGLLVTAASTQPQAIVILGSALLK